MQDTTFFLTNDATIGIVRDGGGGGAVEGSCFGTSDKLLGDVEAIDATAVDGRPRLGEIKEGSFGFVAFSSLLT